MVGEAILCTLGEMWRTRYGGLYRWRDESNGGFREVESGFMECGIYGGINIECWGHNNICFTKNESSLKRCIE